MTEKKAILIYPDVSCLDKTNKNLDEKKYNATRLILFQ